MSDSQQPIENQGLNVKGSQNDIHDNQFVKQQGIIANDQAKIEIGKVEQTMGDRVEQNHSGSGDNVAGDKNINVYLSPQPLQPTGDGPPTNLQDRGVARDRFFGRDRVLAELHQLLQKGDHRVAIASVDGMGGVGKSELAVQYARQHLHDTYRGGVVWLAGERAGVELLNFARSRFFPTVDLADLGDLPEQLAYCFGHWPAEDVPPESVLLIFDDVTDYRTQVGAILPSDRRFRVLITTRAKFQGVERLELQVLTPEAAFQLLESIVGTERIAAESETAAALCEWLGFLPLGIELVGYYLKRKGDLSLATMQERLEAKRLQAPAIAPKDRDFPEGMTARRGVAAAFELSWQALDSEAQRLAVLLGCFGPAPVLWEWVLGCLPNDDEEDLEDACGQLVKLSLVKAEDGQYALHPLIREFFGAKRADWPEGGALQQAFLGQMVSVAKTVPKTVTLADLARTRPAWLHLEVAAAASGDIADSTDSIWPFVALARLAEGQGLWADAENHYAACLTATETRFGPDHPATAAILNNLANLYRSQGRYAEAEPLYRRSLAIDEQVYGPDHHEVATGLNNLAGLYRSQGRYAEAEALFRRSLAICEQVLGADHPDTAQSLNNLAFLYYSQGRYAEAEPLFRRSLAIKEQVLGADHPDTAQSLNNLAELYRSQGRYAEAEPLFWRSLAIIEQVLEADHPNTASSLNNLANLYQSQGRYAEAEPLFRRSLAIREQVLGADHPDTAQSLNNLANLYQSQGRYAEAEPLLRRSLEIREKVLGTDHPDTAQSLNNLAFLYQSQGWYEAAEPLYRRCLEIFLAKLGQDHPNTQTVLGNFITFVQTAVQQGRAADLSDHPLTQSILQQLTAPPNP